jgi:HlyD family secretion protein
MKRLVVPLIVVALAAAAFLNRDRWLPQPEGHLNYLGYIEGETRLIAPPQAGRLVAVSVGKGQQVKPGETLFTLDTAQAVASLDAAEAQLQAARATHQNLLSGKRQEEIAVIHAQIAQAGAGLELAQKELERAASLASTGTAALSRLDQASEQVTTYQQRIAELKASEKVAGLPAREAEIATAQSRIREAEAQVDAAGERLKDLSPVAPVVALVEDVFFRAGEWVAAGQPVVSLLDPADITIRFFVPQAVLAKAAPGTRITYECDGCSGPKTATIVHVASQPEYTPPVIYSETARAKLVFLVEARPDAGDSELRPGLPIAVEPLP